MRLLLLAVVLALAVVHVPTALADEVSAYEVEGSAPAGTADDRVRALDAAFAAAVEQALVDLVPTRAREARRSELAADLVARARIWVASFKVTGDRTQGGTRTLQVTVRIARDLLKARLAELGLAVRAPVTAAPLGGALVVIGTGPVASDAPGVIHAVQAEIAARGWQVVAVEAMSDAELQALDDSSARALAGPKAATVVVLVRVVLEGQGPVQGAGVSAALAMAQVRVLEASGASVHSVGRAGAYQDDGDAGPLAAAAAVVDAFRAAAPRIRHPAVVAGEDELAVRVQSSLAGNVGPVTVAALRERVRGATGAPPRMRRIQGGQLMFAAKTEHTAEQVAQRLRGQSSAGAFELSVRVVEGSLQVDVGAGR
jgi:hypothetical protein